MSKINERDIRVIRKTKLTYKDLAEVFGISKHTVAKIKRREIWKHV
jgi:DNA-binding Xre family transcriptional regulator